MTGDCLFFRNLFRLIYGLENTLFISAPLVIEQGPSPKPSRIFSGPPRVVWLGLSRDGMQHMMFKLGQCAEEKWRKLRRFDYLAKFIIGVQFKDAIEVSDNNQAGT